MTILVGWLMNNQLPDWRQLSEDNKEAGSTLGCRYSDTHPVNVYQNSIILFLSMISKPK